MAWIAPFATSVLTSAALRSLGRGQHSVSRRLSGRAARIFYFHQPDDPYSHRCNREFPIPISGARL